MGRNGVELQPWQAAVPVALAIGVFGVVYGAVAEAELGGPTTLVSSLLVFSGAAQFTMIALLAADAGMLGVLAGVAPLALRHVPLAAIVRPGLSPRRHRRALVSWFLIDETVGLALARPHQVERTMLVAGSLSYGAWVVGTAAGVLGASLSGLESLASALFPVLFIGLAALTARDRPQMAGAALTGVVVVALLSSWPAAGVVGAIAVALVITAAPVLRART
jgi:predicted branched-subunit amino acid permease